MRDVCYHNPEYPAHAEQQMDEKGGMHFCTSYGCWSKLVATWVIPAWLAPASGRDDNSKTAAGPSVSIEAMNYMNSALTLYDQKS